MSLKKWLLRNIAEPAEDLAEGVIEEGVEELDAAYEAWASGEADIVIAKMGKKLPTEAAIALDIASELVKPLLMALATDGANQLVEYIWRKAQEINPKDKTSAAPRIGDDK